MQSLVFRQFRFYILDTPFYRYISKLYVVISQDSLKSELWVPFWFLSSDLRHKKMCLKTEFLVPISDNVWNLKCLETQQLPSVWNPKLFRFQTLTVLDYSKHLKFERSDFGAFQSFPIQVRFQTFSLPTGTKPNVRFLDDPLS